MDSWPVAFCLTCSEEEDRDLSCVVSSLVQLMLDPHYRSLAGFQSLVQKEWVMAGHRFLDRCNHLKKNDKEEVLKWREEYRSQTKLMCLDIYVCFFLSRFSPRCSCSSSTACGSWWTSILLRSSSPRLTWLYWVTACGSLSSVLFSSILPDSKLSTYWWGMKHLLLFFFTISYVCSNASSKSVKDTDGSHAVKMRFFSYILE